MYLRWMSSFLISLCLLWLSGCVSGRSRLPLSEVTVPVDVTPAPAVSPVPTFTPTPVPEHQDQDSGPPAVAMELPCPVAAPSLSLYCDKEVLLAVRDKLRGANAEALQTWQQDRAIEDFECVSLGRHPRRVIALDCRGMSPAGSIPQQLSQLPLLQRLVLRESQLHGPIPPELGLLPHLTVLDLEWNFLSGGTPAELGQLTQLQELNLSHNLLGVPSRPN